MLIRAFQRPSVWFMLGAGLVAGAAVLAGPLNPPAGAVTGTYKTLSEVEPRIAINATNTPGDEDSEFRISQPGSYYLTGNITGVPNKHGIEIASSGVTLDLNGFELLGVAGSLDGVNVSAIGGRHVIIKNGSLRAWGDCGIEVEYNSGQVAACRFVGVSSSLNGRAGFYTFGDSGFIDCDAFENGNDGIVAVGVSQLKNCSARHNIDEGFSLNYGCSLENCVATANTTRGFTSGVGCAFSNCTAEQNGIGFVSFGSSYTNCAARRNFGDGYDLSSGSTLVTCVANDNAGNGIDASNHTTISDCSVFSNDAVGINVGSGCTVRACTASANAGAGIQAGSNSQVRGNTATNNGGANLRVTNSDNLIEGNNCADAPIGVEIASAGNVIVRNTCSGNTTNWSIVANNYYGPIIDRAGAVTPPVNGDFAADALASTHPNANFTY